MPIDLIGSAWLVAVLDGVQFHASWNDVAAVVVAILTGFGFVVKAIWTTRGTLAQESKETALLRQSVNTMATKLDEALADKRDEHKAMWERVTSLHTEVGQLRERVRVLEVRGGA